MDDADVRKRCEQVFRDATGHPSFLGRGGVDLRDVFAGMIRAAYADGLAASERELQAIRDTVGDTEFSLRQQLADMTRERDEYKRACSQAQDDRAEMCLQLADMTRERDDWQKSAQQFNGTYEALHQRVAETQRTTDQLRAEFRRIECINHDLEQQVTRLREALTGYAECTDGCTCGDGWGHETAQQALRETEAP